MLVRIYCLICCSVTNNSLFRIVVTRRTILLNELCNAHCLTVCQEYQFNSLGINTISEEYVIEAQRTIHGRIMMSLEIRVDVLDSFGVPWFKNSNFAKNDGLIGTFASHQFYSV